MSSQAATRREIAGMQDEAEGMQSSRILDGTKENSLRSQTTNQLFGMLKYEAIPGGSQVMGTILPIRKGVEFYDWTNNQHILQKATNTMNNTTMETAGMQNQNTQQVTDQKIEASNTYQNEVNSAFEQQASETIGAVNAGTNIAANSAKQSAGIQITGINKSTGMEKLANQLNFEVRIEAAGINQQDSTGATHLRMVGTVVNGFFRDLDRRLEEMKPKY